MTPEVGRFQGIKISLYNRNEHNSPHVHVMYAEHVACISIRSQRVLKGSLPAKQESLAKKWIATNKNELLKMWNDRMKPGGINRIKD